MATEASAGSALSAPTTVMQLRLLRLCASGLPGAPTGTRPVDGQMNGWREMVLEPESWGELFVCLLFKSNINILSINIFLGMSLIYVIKC